MMERREAYTISARHKPICAGTFACAATLLLAAGVSPREFEARHAGRHQLSEGRQVFESRCSGCHGLDGRGGERAPDIATRAVVQRRSDAEIARIIQSGVPASGMPGFATLDEQTLQSLVAYLRLLQGKTDGAHLPGTPEKGKALFFGKGRCAECHMVDGHGGFIASDLSVYGRTRSAEEIREAITKPDATNRQGVELVVTTKDGGKYSGVARNEDNFSLQLQSLNGEFFLFQKSDIINLARRAEPLMPANYGSVLSRDELNDLLSFLIASAKNGKDPTNAKKKVDEDEEDE